jgi:serine/threonine protein kinase
MPAKLLHYDVLERLGEGAGSTIYRVRDPSTGRELALKHVVRSDQKDIRFVEQMETEFEISRQFTHPNLRRSYELKIQKTMLVKTAEAFLANPAGSGRSRSASRGRRTTSPRSRSPADRSA